MCVYSYLKYAIYPISPMLLVYISLDRFITIKYPTKRFFFRRERNQLVYFLIVFVFNLIYYIPIAFEYSIINLAGNETNQTDLQCGFTDLNAQIILSWMDLANSVIVPFTLTFSFTCLIAYTIFRSRARTRAVSTTTENHSRARDIKFSITCLVLNLIFLVLNLPVTTIAFFPLSFYSFLFSFVFCLLYLSFSVNFYILLATNSLVRHEFLNLFVKKSAASRASSNFHRTTI